MGKSIKITLLCCGLLGLAAGVYAQNKETRIEEKQIKEENRQRTKALTSQFLVFDYGASWGTLRDTRMSTLRYAGPGAGLAVGYWPDQPTHNWRFTFASGQYQALAGVGDNSLTHAVRLESEAVYLRQVASVLYGAMDIRVGASAGNLLFARINPELSNTSVHFDDALSIGPSAMSVLEMPWRNKPLRIEYQLTVPLTGVYFHWPEYVLSGWGSGGATAIYPGRYERVKSQLRIQRALGRNGMNRMQLTYTWDYSRFRDPLGFRAQYASQGVNFSLLFRL